MDEKDLEGFETVILIKIPFKPEKNLDKVTVEYYGKPSKVLSALTTSIGDVAIGTEMPFEQLKEAVIDRLEKMYQSYN